MSSAEPPSSAENSRPLGDLFFDRMGDYRPKSDRSSKARRKAERCAGAASDHSSASNSNFDEDLSVLLERTGQTGDLLDLLNKKYFIGYAISEAFSGTDLDAFTLFHLWNTKRTSQKSLVLSNQAFNWAEDNPEFAKRPDPSSHELFVVFYQQLFFSWQAQLRPIDRSRPIFRIPPQDGALVHAVDPKTSALVILTYVYKLSNVRFIGLFNDPAPSGIPGPYLSLAGVDSHAAFMTCLGQIQDLVFRGGRGSAEPPAAANFNVDGYLNLSYFVSELDLVLSFVLFSEPCYSSYTEPMLLKSFTSWSFGKAVLLPRLYRTRARFRDLSTAQVLSRFDAVLALVCRVFCQFKAAAPQGPLDKFRLKNFNFLAFTAVAYTYMYAILSVPLELLPWENFVPDAPVPGPKEPPGDDDGSANAEPSDSARPASADADAGHATDDELAQKYSVIDMPVHNEFAETAADSTCVENTRRHDNLMSYVIGLVTGEGNWIKKSVDVIDTYKLGLAWYRRPSFSNTLYSASYRALPIALYHHSLLVEPCGRSFFVWFWRNTEAWGSSDVWSYRPRPPARAGSGFARFLGRLARRPPLMTDSNLHLKRQVCLRLRDVAACLLDMELELKRALLYM